MDNFSDKWHGWYAEFWTISTFLKRIQAWKSKIICDSISVSDDVAIPMEYIKSENNSGDKTRKSFKLKYALI
jgi:hypothetical protein